MENLYNEFVSAMANVGFDAENLNEMSFMQIKDMILTLDSLVEENRPELESIEGVDCDGELEAKESLADFREEVSLRVDEIWEELRRLADTKRDRKGV
jgi:hypothetical protein